jgi:hypothetical protein
MPAHLPLLGEAKARLLAGYVYSLSRDEDQDGSKGHEGEREKDNKRE